MLDNMGNDLVRLIAFRIRRPVVVAGLSSGGLLAAWLSAYAPPGMLRGAYYEDPPLFASELSPECGPGMRQHVVSDTFALAATYLGDQWQVGDWEGYLARAATNPMLGPLLRRVGATPEEVPQTWKEYDAASGKLVGAMTDQQAARVQDLVRATGQLVEFHAFPQMPHNMHGTDPDRYAGLLLEWAARLPTEEETRKSGVFATSSALVG